MSYKHCSTCKCDVLCLCAGPYSERDPGRWSHGRDGVWYEATEKCPLHGHRGCEERLKNGRGFPYPAITRTA